MPKRFYWIFLVDPLLRKRNMECNAFNIGDAGAGLRNKRTNEGHQEVQKIQLVHPFNIVVSPWGHGLQFTQRQGQMAPFFKMSAKSERRKRGSQSSQASRIKTDCRVLEGEKETVEPAHEVL